MNSLIYKAIGMLIALGVAFVVGWQVKGWKDDSEYKHAYTNLVAQVNAEEQYNLNLSRQYTKELKTYQHMGEEINHHVKVEVKTYPSYDDCVVPLSGVQLINAAVDQANQIKSTD